MRADRRRRWLVAGLCALGAAKCAALGLAWPFFGSVDEQHHLDRIVKTARGHWPRALERYDPESARLIAGAESWEPMHPAPVAWSQAEHEAAWRSIVNIESLEAPLYYGLAAAWDRLGAFVPRSDRGRLTWLRMLNPLLVALAVLAAARLAAALFPSDRVLPLATAALVAVLPNDLYASLNADVPGALGGALALLALWRVRTRGALGHGEAVLAGLAVAVPPLAKLANAPVLAPLAWVVWRRFRAARSAERARLATLVLAAVLPVAAWLARNALAAGDPTGGAAKARFLGWSAKPLAAWVEHPLLTVSGAAHFLGSVAATAWRGEQLWHGAARAWPALDVWFAWSTLACLGAAAAGLASRGARPGERAAGILLFTEVATALAVLALLSLAFDFGPCFYPSRAHPFLESARLVSAAFVPFLLLYARGLDRLLRPLGGERARLAAILTLAAALAAADLAMSAPVFRSPFNVFHSP